MSTNRKKGIPLNKILCQKIWHWTQDDVKLLFEGFDLENLTGPSSGYSIYLFCLMDIWGSIMLNDFGDEILGHSDRNVKEFLSRLVAYKPTEYKILDRQGNFTKNIVKELRHNLVHMYGLSVIKSANRRGHLNIDISGQQETMNIQQTNDRWHIDCRRLKNDMLHIIEEWMKQKNYI